MQRLSAITYRLPYSPASTDFLAHLRALLTRVPYAGTAPGRLQLTPPWPAGALPVTAFEVANVPSAEIRFGDAWSLGTDAGSWSPTQTAAALGWSTVGTSAPDATSSRAAPAAAPGHETPAAAIEDLANAHVGLSGSGNDASTQAVPDAGIGMAEFAQRLAGHVVAVDHTGMNLPAAAVPPERWQAIVHAVAGVSTFYRYPTGEPWLFVLPSNEAEYATDIDAFADGREPRFELVRDEWLDGPLWQFALRTDLSRPDLEAMFPDPVGAAFPGLGEVFRAVTVRSPWPGLQIRFDLYYSRIDAVTDRAGALTDWETGEWLVTAGGRIKRDDGSEPNAIETERVREDRRTAVAGNDLTQGVAADVRKNGAS
ncbi:hypothetical protein [Dactylosporangium darangshiense]